MSDEFSPEQKQSESSALPTSEPATKPSPTPPPAPKPEEANDKEAEKEPELPELVRKVCAAIPTLKPYSGVSDTPAVEVAPPDLVKSLTALRDKPEFAFALLIDHTAIDRIADGQFELVYRLSSLTTLSLLLVSTKIPRHNPLIPTVSSIWQIAEWQEREVYDLFGVLYDNHPDLRRVFLEDAWEGFPLRKDYQDDFMLTLERD